MARHELKTWPEFYRAVLDGSKTFELRVDDRGYAAGDTLALREYVPSIGQFTGREAEFAVTYVAHGGGPFGLARGHVCMAIRRLTTPPRHPTAGVDQDLHDHHL